MGKRRSSRELAIKFLYLMDMNPGEIDKRKQEFWERNSCQKEIQSFTDELLDNWVKHKEEIDDLLEKCSQHWALSRMAVIDKNLLRLATCEILYSKTVPPKVAIDEALEIAKKYGSEDSPQFINGILDKILKTNQNDLIQVSNDS